MTGEKKMAIKWQTLLLQVLIWFALEIALNCLGFDDVADYTEFILETKKTHLHHIHNVNSILGIQFVFDGAFCLLPSAVPQLDIL